MRPCTKYDLTFMRHGSEMKTSHRNDKRQSRTKQSETHCLFDFHDLFHNEFVLEGQPVTKVYSLALLKFFRAKVL